MSAVQDTDREEVALAPTASLVGTAIHIADVDRSVAFYRDALGLFDGGRWEHEGIVEVMLRPENGPESPVLILVGGKQAAAGEFAGRLMFAAPNARQGPQPRRLEGAALWVLPNPSGLNAHDTVASLAVAYREVAVVAGIVPATGGADARP